ncbi:MAG: Uma2 family endonuclease [Myxococcota bacterium]
MREYRRTPATSKDLDSVPEGWTGQIVDGELWALPRPAFAHGRVSSELGYELIGPFGRGRGGPGGWIILDEPELHLERDVLVPDLAGWRRDRLAETAADAAFLTVAPDWVCEVLSPSTVRLDRVKKWRCYLRERVQWIWFIDPIGRTLEAYALSGADYARLGTWEAGERARVAPFDAIELELDALWGPEPAP